MFKFFLVSFSFFGKRSVRRRWEEIITHVPCGGSATSPAGQLLISATIEPIDGPGGTLGFAGPTSVWSECMSISTTGDMTFDIDDVDDLEEDGGLGAVIVHEMGHVIGIG